MKQIWAITLFVLIGCLNSHALAPRSQFGEAESGLVRTVVESCLAENPQLQKKLRYTPKDDLCLKGAGLLIQTLGKKLQIPVNDPSQPTRLELVDGYYDSNRTDADYRNSTLFHRWIQLVVNNTPVLFIDPTFGQFEPEFNGMTLVTLANARPVNLREFTEELLHEVMRSVPVNSHTEYSLNEMRGKTPDQILEILNLNDDEYSPDVRFVFMKDIIISMRRAQSVRSTPPRIPRAGPVELMRTALSALGITGKSS
ncbi:MAG: hypothetical protein JW774_07105 [Candidatus Aureabacteria bacterium]|nr:hypothetical protein [Candidatus Auribacterota bacterium]